MTRVHPAFCTSEPACPCMGCHARRHLLTPERRADSAERMRARWADPAWRAARVAAQTGVPRPASVRHRCRMAALRPEARAASSERMRAQHADPDWHARALAAANAPEALAKKAEDARRRAYVRRVDLGLTEAEYAEMKRLRHKGKCSTAEAVAMVKADRRRR